MGTAVTLYGVLKRLADLLQLRSQVIERNVGGIHIEIQRLVHDGFSCQWIEGWFDLG